MLLIPASGDRTRWTARVTQRNPILQKRKTQK